MLLGVAVPLGSMRLQPLALACSTRSRSPSSSPIATQVAFNSGRIVTFVYPLLALAIGTLGTLAVLYVGETIERERVRDVFSRFVPGAGRRRGAREHRREPAPRRRGTRLHGSLLRPARLHELLRDAARGARDRRRQLLPQRDDRGDPRRRRDADRLHGRRDHGRLRRAARAGGPRRPRGRRRARDDRASAWRTSTRGSPSRASSTASRWASGSTAAP